MPGEGHGVLVAPQWVVTAAHAVTWQHAVDEVVVNGQPRKVERMVLHPGYAKPPQRVLDEALATWDWTLFRSILASSDDIALLKLAQPVTDVSPAVLNTDAREYGEVVQIIGKGATGKGNTGYAFEDPHRTQLRRAYNRISSAHGRWICYVFDEPSSALPLEGGSGSGDSGGPILMESDGRWVVAGLTSWTDPQSTVRVPGRYGQVSCNVRLSHYRAWMDSVINTQQSRDQATITIKPAGRRLQVSINLSRARDTIRFREATTPRESWTINTSGVRWSGGALIAATPLRRVVLTVDADTTENGRGYLSAVRVGEGWQLHGPAFVLADYRTNLVPSVPSDWLVQPKSSLARGYFYVGPGSQLRRRATHETISGNSVPTALRSFADSALAAAMKDHARRFGMPLRDRPVMIITTDGPRGAFAYRGDVTDGGVLSLRFGRDITLNGPASVRTDIWLFVAHEAAHLWNSHYARADDLHPFLHEGGAEYAALRAAVSAQVLSAEGLRSRLSARLTECRRQVGSRDSLQQRMARGGAVYDCGTVLQWITDLESSGGPGGYERTWRGLVARSVSTGAPYTWEQFRTQQPDTTLAARWFNMPPENRWSAFDDHLRRLGVEWEDAPSSQEYVVSALMHLGRQVCARGASVGFALINGRLRFDQEPKCGPIANGPEILAIESIDPLVDGATLFSRVEQRCQAKLAVRLSASTDGKVVELPCTLPPPRPAAYRITKLPQN